MEGAHGGRDGHLEPHGAHVPSGVVHAGDDQIPEPDLDRGLQGLQVLGSEYINLVMKSSMIIGKVCKMI